MDFLSLLCFIRIKKNIYIYWLLQSINFGITRANIIKASGPSAVVVRELETFSTKFIATLI
jgi:hypothetical protein